MAKQAQVLWSSESYTVLEADYGDLDPTSGAPLLAGVWLVTPEGSIQHIGDPTSEPELVWQYIAKLMPGGVKGQ